MALVLADPRAVRCPKCACTLVQRRFDPGVVVDVCLSCRGAWLDEGEAVFFTERPDELKAALGAGLVDGRPTTFDCPRCRDDLEVGRLDGGVHSIERCTRCGGFWVDASEMGADTIVVPLGAADEVAADAVPRKRLPRQEPARLPPTLEGHPLRNALEFFRDPVRTLCRAADLGDVVRIPLAHQTAYLVNTPEAVKHVLQESSQNYSRGHSQATRMLRPFLGKGVLTTDGSGWRARRRVLQTAFAGDRLAEMDSEMKDEVIGALSHWHASAPPEPVDVYREALLITVGTTMRSLFGYRVTPGERRDLAAAIVDGQTAAWANLLTPLDLSRWLATPDMLRGKRVRAVVGRLASGVIRARQSAPGSRHDMLGALLEAHASVDEVRDEIITMMTAAPENMAYTLSMALYLLAEHPEVEARLVDEIDRVLAGRQPVASDLDEMPLTACVLKETLRLYPGAYMFDRWVVHDDRIDGFEINAGSFVLMSPYTMHRRADLWPDPERFAPDRFAAENRKDKSRFAFMPFGGGPHQCIGEQFAMMQLRLVLPLVLQRFRFRRAPGHSVEHVSMFTLRPRRGVHLRVEHAPGAATPRRTPASAPSPVP